MNGRRMRTSFGVTSSQQAEFREPMSETSAKPERPIVGLPGLRSSAARRTAWRPSLGLESAGRIALVVLGLLAAVGGARGQELGPAPFLPESERHFQLVRLNDAIVPPIDTRSRLAVIPGPAGFVY